MQLYQVDAFTNRIFGGNPAAVVPLSEWIEDDLMQKIALENNLSETAFFVPEKNGYGLRWFTPVNEINLCGHATLASSYVIFEILKTDKTILEFYTRSGTLFVSRADEGYTMDFPLEEFDAVEISDNIKKIIGVEPLELYRNKKGRYMALLGSEKEVLDVNPDFAKLKLLNAGGFIITAEGESSDFVSRAFFPEYDINEDPVCGSAHCMLTPFWAKRSGKNVLTARQLSKRGGEIGCKIVNGRVEISGEAVLYMTAEIFV
jgi:PhzF family phenazine biosynthesis protein